MVKGEGMPQYRNPFEKGDLFVKFDVQFPDNNWINPEKLVVSYNILRPMKHKKNHYLLKTLSEPVNVSAGT